MKTKYSSKNTGNASFSITMNGKTHSVSLVQVRTKNMGRKKTDLKNGDVLTGVDSNGIQYVAEVMEYIAQNPLHHEGSFVSDNTYRNQYLLTDWKRLVSNDDLSMQTIKISVVHQMHNGYGDGWFYLATIITK